MILTIIAENKMKTPSLSLLFSTFLLPHGRKCSSKMTLKKHTKMHKCLWNHGPLGFYGQLHIYSVSKNILGQINR